MCGTSHTLPRRCAHNCKSFVWTVRLTLNVNAQEIDKVKQRRFCRGEFRRRRHRLRFHLPLNIRKHK
jgi:hypothetical protein